MRNNEDIFDKYVKPHIKGLFIYAYKMTKDYFLSEDLVQETVIRFIEKFSSIRKKESIKSWLFKTLKNRFLDKIRKHKRIVLMESETIEKDYNKFQQLKISLEERFLNKDLSKEIGSIIDKLPDVYKEVIILNEIENLKYSEIADILDIPLGTVKSRLSRAKKLLEVSLYKIAIREGILRDTNNEEYNENKNYY